MRKTKNAAKAAYLYITGKGTQVVCALFFAIFVVSFASISIYARVAQAATNNTINFQARILMAGGNVVADGNYSVEFKIYNAAIGGSSEWSDTFVTSAKNGYITTSLGSGVPFDPAIDWSQEHWLTMNINGDGEMGPSRMKITAVPYAFTAGRALNVLSANTSAASTSSNSISVQTGNATGLTSNSGNITVDTGTATGTTGTISIGTINASGVTVGRIGLQTNIAGTALISGGAATLGTATQAGSLIFNDGIGGQTTALLAGNSAANLSFTLPTTTGAALECLQNSATPGVLQFGACGAGGGTLQTAYDNSVGAIITATATDGALRVRDASTTFGNNSVFAVQNNTGTVDYLAVQGDGDVAIDTNSLFVDAANNRVGIGTATPGSVLHVTNVAPVSVAVATGTAQVAVANFAAGTGGSTTIATTGTGGAGGAFTVTGGIGGQATAAAVASSGGAGGALNLNGGAGGAASVAGTGNNTGGNGGAFTWAAGTGGAANGATSGNNIGGNGGAVALQAGTGGTATTGTGNLVGGNGGTLTFSGGTGGVGVTSGGNGGAVTLQGGTAAAMAGAAGGAATVSGRAGSATGSGGNGGALTLQAGSAGGDNSVNRTGGAVAITAGASRGSSAGGAITVTAGTGGNNLTVDTATGGNSGGITLSGGNGGIAPNATIASTGGMASGISFSGGTGGAASVAGTGNNTGGAGGTSVLSGGNGGTANGATSGINTGGNGGGFTLQGGNGGAANTGTGSNIGGSGGALLLSGGTGGVGVTSGGNGGTVTIQGGAAAAMPGAAGGAATISGRNGSTTGSGGNGGTLTLQAGSAGGDNTVNRTGGNLTLTAGASRGASAGGAVSITAGAGGNNLAVGTATGGNAGGITFNGSNGGTAPNATVSSTGGTAGGFTISGGTGGAAAVAGTGNNTGGNGGAFTWSAGNGGAATGATTGINTGGLGGTITLLAGTGGAATTGTGTLQGGAGGGLILQAGTGGAGTVAGAGGVLTLRGGTSNSAGGDIILQTSPTTTLTERMRVTNSGYVGIGTAAGTALPNARLSVVAENVTNSQIELRSQRVAIVANNVIGGVDFDTNDSNLTAPGLTTARIQAVATATHTAAVTDTALIFSTASGTTLSERWRISATGELQGNGASLIRANAGNLTVGTVTSGNIVLDGAGTVEVQDNININSSQLTNYGSTVNGVLAIGNIAVNGNIGTAIATVDVKTAITIAQTTAGRTLTLPTPTLNGLAGRIVYISNIGSTSFTMHGVVVANGASQSYIYNGSTWAPTNVGGGGAGVNTIGTIDSQAKSADGAVISGTTLYLQTADNTNPGLLSAGLQTIGGDKTLTGTTTFSGTGTALVVSNDASVTGLLTTGSLNVSGLTTLSGNMIANSTSTGITGTTLGSGASTSTLNLASDVFNVNDVVYINNAGQDYYTRITVDPGTGSYTVSPSVSFDAGATVTKYNVQNIGATGTDYSNLANRFFQGYFLGGVVVGAGSTTLSDGNLSSTTDLSIQKNGGLVQFGGNVAVTGTLTGNGSGLTNIDGSQIVGGSIGDASLSDNVTILGNTFNGASQLLQLDASGALPALSGNALTNLNAASLTGNLPALNGSALTSLNAANINSGTLDDLRLSSNVTLKGNSFNSASQLVLLDASGNLPTLNGSALTNLSSANLTGNLPALNGSALTSLSAANISSGTFDDAHLSSNVTLKGNDFNSASQLVLLDASGGLPSLNASALTDINATNISSGTLDDARLSSNVTTKGNTFNGASNLVLLDASGALPTLNGSALTNLNSASLTGNLPALNGSALTTLNATNISSGTIDDLRLSTNVTIMGNTFNGNNQLVKLNGSGALPALNGAALTTLSAGNISSGTLDDLRLSGNVTLKGNSFNSNNQLVLLDASGNLPALNGSALTSLDASNISGGTLDDARLSSNVTTKGNTFNGASNLVLLDASGALPTLNGSALTNLSSANLTGNLPALNGSALTSLNAANISSGTIDDLRLSTNVTIMGNTFNAANKLVQLDGTGALPALNGVALTTLNASNISSGTIDNARLNTNVTILGNTTNAANGLVKLDASGNLPSLNGSALTSLSSSNLVGALPSLDGSALTNLSSSSLSGALPALDGSALTNLSAGNIASGTIDDLRLSTNVTIMGNTFNGNNQLVKLSGTGALPALNGAALTNLNAGSVASGTLGDGYLSNNITRLGTSQAFTASQTFESNIIIGTDTASPNAGLISFNDITGSNGFTATLGVSTTLTGNRNIYMPDESGTLCIRGSSACGFIMLGNASAQADDSNNSSIFISKGAAATGNLVTLQKNGATVYSVLNNGALQLALTDASAFTVSGVGGTTQFFNVDTSNGLVRIGGATDDANATLLVLDTKNTAGDPSGVNGGSYYNSADGKNRCYENGAWTDCINLAIAGETTIGAANATINVTLNGNYEYLQCRVDIKGRSASSMVYLRFNNDTGAASYSWNQYGIPNTAVTDSQDNSDSEIQLPGTLAANTPFSANMNITNFGDTRKGIDWTAVGLDPIGTNANRYSGVGIWGNTTNNITSMQIVASTGTFNAGSHAWCQGRNIR